MVGLAVAMASWWCCTVTALVALLLSWWLRRCIALAIGAGLLQGLLVASERWLVLADQISAAPIADCTAGPGGG
jgi:hypothetical protein